MSIVRRQSSSQHIRARIHRGFDEIGERDFPFLPRAAKASDIAKPMPPAPPVITATRPEKGSDIS